MSIETARFSPFPLPFAGTGTAADVCACELAILGFLEWRVVVATSHDFAQAMIESGSFTEEVNGMVRRHKASHAPPLEGAHDMMESPSLWMGERFHRGRELDPPLSPPPFLTLGLPCPRAGPQFGPDTYVSCIGMMQHRGARAGQRLFAASTRAAGVA